MPIFAPPEGETEGWRCGRVEDGSVHVEPVNDLVEHEVVDCLCVPRVEPVQRDDGSFGWMVVHQSLDNREARERESA